MTINSVQTENALLDTHRSVLLGDLEGLSVDELDRRIFPETMSIATSILHTAAFEYLLTAAIRQAQGEPIDSDLWEAVRYGFSRDLDLEQPTGHSLEYYTDVLAAVRSETDALIEDTGTTLPADLDFESLLLELGEAEADAESLAMIVSRKVTTGGDGRLVLPVEITLHESYHRGQITFTKYLYGEGITERCDV